jgi:serine/threonine protein kinase
LFLGPRGQATVKQTRHEKIGTFVRKSWMGEEDGEGSWGSGILLFLHHPNIVRPFAYSPSHGPGSPRAYAMEYMRRGGLDVCARVMSLDEKCATILDIASAGEFIHGRGFVHGNLKPSSVVIDAPFRVVVTDFGTVGLRGEATRTRFIFAPAYAAPEVLRGSMPTPESDVFSEALVIAFALSGRPWMSGDATDVQI